MQSAVSILAVDDDPSVAQALSFALSAKNRDLAIAASVDEAMAAVAKRPFDVVITDNQMPVQTGLELVRRLRETCFSGKIMVLTAYLSEKLAREYGAFQVDRMMAKPFNVGELRRAIDELAAAA